MFWGFHLSCHESTLDILSDKKNILWSSLSPEAIWLLDRDEDVQLANFPFDLLPCIGASGELWYKNYGCCSKFKYGSTFSVYDNTANKPLYKMRNLDITPYYPAICNSSYQYTFANETQPITKTSFSVAVPTSVVLSNLVAITQVLTFHDNWDVAEGFATVRFVHLAPQNGPISILGNGTSCSISFQEASQYQVFKSNLQYAWNFVDVASNTVILDEFLFLNDQTSYTIWIQGLSNNLGLVMTQDYPPDVPSN